MISSYDSVCPNTISTGVRPRELFKEKRHGRGPKREAHRHHTLTAIIHQIKKGNRLLSVPFHLRWSTCSTTRAEAFVNSWISSKLSSRKEYGDRFWVFLLRSCEKLKYAFSIPQLLLPQKADVERKSNIASEFIAQINRFLKSLQQPSYSETDLIHSINRTVLRNLVQVCRHDTSFFWHTKTIVSTTTRSYVQLLAQLKTCIYMFRLVAPNAVRTEENCSGIPKWKRIDPECQNINNNRIYPDSLIRLNIVWWVHMDSNPAA